MNEIADSYENVQIFKLAAGHFYYSIIPTILQVKKGLDAINLLLADDQLEEVMFIGPKKYIKVYHSKYGMCNTNISLTENESLTFISEIAVKNKKIINHSQPLLDATLPDGSRVNATISPASVDGSTFTIRKFKKSMITVLDLMRLNTTSPEIAAFLWTCVEGLNVKPANILFVGGTGSGKTTNLNAFSMFIPFDSRIISIEDTPELQLSHDHIVRLEVVPNSKIGMQELLINCLRMRPDRIIVGEVRGEEAKSLFTAMNTGHEGCMGTLHANTTKESLLRITEDPMSVPTSMLTGLDLIVMQQRVISGKQHSRHITEIAELSSTPTGTDLPKFNLLYKWIPLKKMAKKTGVPSRIRERIAKAAGITPKDFDNLVKKREEILTQAQNSNFNIKQFHNLIINNSY